MKESLRSRLFSLGMVLMVMGAVVVGSWVHALVLVIGLAAHEVARRWALPGDGAAAARGTGSADVHP